MTASEIVIAALKEILVVGVGQDARAEDVVDGLAKLNLLLDTWNAKRHAIYADQVVTGTLTPSLQPHTIGPTGTLVVTQRPVSIEYASLVIGTTRQRINIRDMQWWSENTTPAMTGSEPTDLNYRPDWPNGALYFWPVPTSAYGIELQTRRLLAQLVAADTFTLPPGYQEAILLTLAEKLCPMFEKSASQELKDGARDARATVFGNNDVTPRLVTAGSGLPGGDGFWDYMTGRYR